MTSSGFSMLRRNADLFVVGGLAVLSAIIVEVVDDVAGRVIFAIPLLLVLPGYALCAAIFARHRLGFAYVALLSLGLSLATLVLGSVLLDASSIALRSESWTLVQLCVLATSVAVAIGRRGSAGPLMALPRVRIRARDLVLLLLGASIAVGAVAFARTPLPAKKVQGYTAFWLLPPRSPHAASLRLGVTSSELQTQSYRVVVTQGQRLLYERGALRLAPGATWTVTIPSANLPRKNAVTARLYRSQRPGEIYRSVRLWLASPRASK
jgi:uncharacterized membrane protein